MEEHELLCDKESSAPPQTKAAISKSNDDDPVADDARVVILPLDRRSWSYQCVLDKRIHGDRIEYLIERTTTWEDANSIEGLNQAVLEYEEVERDLDGTVSSDESCHCTLCPECTWEEDVNTADDADSK
jgi:hypothetical protein